MWNVCKAWLLVAGGCAVIGAIGWAIGGYRLVSLLVFFALLVAGAAYWYGARVVLGMVGARELPLAAAKFGLRAVAQSMARELAPKNIHVAHLIIA